jgi:hypothetical protein
MRRPRRASHDTGGHGQGGAFHAAHFMIDPAAPVRIIR